MPHESCRGQSRMQSVGEDGFRAESRTERGMSDV